MEQTRGSIGLDIGTTSVKAIAFDDSGQEVVRVDERLQMDRAQPGMAEQSADDVYRTATNVLAVCFERARACGCKVEQVGLSAAMHSLLAVDGEGRPLTGAMTWLDTRAKHHAGQMWAGPGGVAWYERTGTPVHAMSPACKLVWLRQVRPDVFTAAKRFVSLKEYTWFRWFGEWRVDESIASATGLFNLRTRTWDEASLVLTSLDEERLSKLVPTTYQMSAAGSQSLQEAGLSSDVVVTIGASDGALANLGLSALSPETAVLTVGTSLALRTGSVVPQTDPSFRPFCYVLDEQHYIVGCPSNSGGIVLDWLCTHVLRDAQGLDALIHAAADVEIGTLVCLPYMAGERAPLWDESATGAFVGLQIVHGPAHLVRAAVEAIVFNAYGLAQDLFDKLGRPERLMVSGKLFRSLWIRQLVCDLIRVPVVYQADEDASTVGAVMLAHQARGGSWQRRCGEPVATDQHAGPNTSPFEFPLVPSVMVGTPVHQRLNRFQELLQIFHGVSKERFTSTKY